MENTSDATKIAPKAAARSAAVAHPVVHGGPAQEPLQQGRAGEHERPEQEDLALDGQRPEVLQRAGA